MINKIIDRVVKQIDFAGMFKRQPKKVSVLKDLFNDPDAFEFNGYVENGEIKISIRKRMKDEKEA